MRFQCPACDCEGVSTLIPAGNARYAVCSFCASYYLSPMPDPKSPQREVSRQKQQLTERLLVSRSAQKQVVRLLKGLCQGVAGRVATNLDPTTLPADYRWASADTLHKGQERFRAVVLFGFIETCPDPAQRIEWLGSRLEPGGLLVLSAANARFAARVLALKQARNPRMANVGALLRPDRRRVVYTPRGLCALLERSGFEQVRVTSAAPTVTDKATSHVQLLTYALSRLIDFVAPRLTLAGSIVCAGVRKE